MDRHCPACEARQVFGVVMEFNGARYFCPECDHTEPAGYARSFPRAVDPFDERRRERDAERAAAALDRLTGVERDESDSPLEGLAEVYEADTSRRGRDVAPNAGGGGNGRIRKPEPNWRRWIRRGT